MKFLLIKGNVVGGHRIEDLGLTVPYQKTKRVHSDRAGWSSDLAKAISRGQVKKMGIEEPRRRPQIYQNHPQSSRKKSKKDRNNPLKVSDAEAEMLADDPTPELENQAEQVQEAVVDNSGELESMKQMNHQLMEKMDDLMSQMAHLVSSQNSSGGSSVDMDQLAQLIAQRDGQSGDLSNNYDDDDDDDLMYIPSQIRSTNTKANVDVEEGESSGSTLDDAAKALSSLKKSSS